VNSKRVVLSILTILIMITPIVGVSNLDPSHGPVLWILKAESGDASIDVGLDEIELGCVIQYLM
jgi:hypothetical protein